VPPDGAEVMITGNRLVYRPQSDQEFPWRDPDDPLHRVYAPYADAGGRLHPAVTVRGAEIQQWQSLLRRMKQWPRRAAAGQDWARVQKSLEQQVADLVRATVEGRPVPPRIEARILTADDVLPREQALAGQYGTFLTAAARAAQGAERPLGSSGHVLALYPAAVLDERGAEERWQARHPAYPAYAVTLERRTGRKGLMSGEGYAGAAAFANTRLTAGAAKPAIDRSFTGVNALFATFEVQLALPPGPSGRQGHRWQPIVALLAMDNLYGDHNPAAMIIADYGDTYLTLLQPPPPPVKPDPDTPPPP
jgi:hypothetical protein